MDNCTMKNQYKKESGLLKGGMQGFNKWDNFTGKIDYNDKDWDCKGVNSKEKISFWEEGFNTKEEGKNANYREDKRSVRD